MPLTRRGFLQATLSALPLTAQAARPNIAVVMADDLGFNDTGYQNPEVRTPNIEGLSARGVRFTQYHSNSVCSPTRASFHTGRTAFRAGVPAPVPRNEALPLTEKLLPEYLAAAGYQTWLAGKWHLGDFAAEYWPHRRGYQHHYGFLGGSLDYYQHTNAMNRLDWFRNGEPVEESGYSTELLAQESIGLIRRRDPERPFFLNLSFNAPHVPLQAPERFLANFAGASNSNRRAYLGAVEAMDEAIGDVYAALEEEGIARNTLFVFASDNGGQTGMGGASNAPLRGAKSGAFEGSLRVPAFLLWPAAIEGGWVFDRMFAVMDWLPTFSNAAQFSLDPAIALDGADMLPFLRDGTWVDRGPVILGGSGNSAVFRDDWKLVEQTLPNGETLHSLFRIASDPLEEHDLASENPELLAGLLALRRSHPAGQPDRA